MKNKKHGNAVLFVCIACWGFRRGTLTQETFREKFLGTSKAFAEISGIFERKFFGTPFSERKVWKSFLELQKLSLK